MTVSSVPRLSCRRHVQARRLSACCRCSPKPCLSLLCDAAFPCGAAGKTPPFLAALPMKRRLSLWCCRQNAAFSCGAADETPSFPCGCCNAPSALSTPSTSDAPCGVCCVHVCVCLRLSVSVSVYLSLSPSVSVCLLVCLSVSLCLSVCLSVCVWLCPCLSAPNDLGPAVR